MGDGKYALSTFLDSIFFIVDFADEVGDDFVLFDHVVRIYAFLDAGQGRPCLGYRIYPLKLKHLGHQFVLVHLELRPQVFDFEITRCDLIFQLGD